MSGRRLGSIPNKTAYLALFIFVSFVSTNQRQLNRTYIIKIRPLTHETDTERATYCVSYGTCMSALTF